MSDQFCKLSDTKVSTECACFLSFLSVTIPEITAELAEQLVNQAAVQQAAGEHTSIQTSTGGILIQSPTGVLHVPEGGTSQGTGQTGMVIGTEVMVQDSDEGQHTEVFDMFSSECRKTKTKVITLANHKRHRQSNEPIRTQSKCMQPAPSARKRLQASYDWFWFWFTSDWLRKWHDIF